MWETLLETYILRLSDIFVFFSPFLNHLASPQISLGGPFYLSSFSCPGIEFKTCAEILVPKDSQHCGIFPWKITSLLMNRRSITFPHWLLIGYRGVSQMIQYCDAKGAPCYFLNYTGVHPCGVEWMHLHTTAAFSFNLQLQCLQLHKTLVGSVPCSHTGDSYWSVGTVWN